MRDMRAMQIRYFKGDKTVLPDMWTAGETAQERAEYHTMKAITLKHPWPWAILCMGKRIENRTWAPGWLRPGDRFAIHGGRAPKPGDELDEVAAQATELLAHFGIPPGVKDVCLADVIRPGIVAVVTFRGIVHKSPDPWFVGPVGWVFDEVRPVVPPIACKGSQGFWECGTLPLESYR